MTKGYKRPPRWWKSGKKRGDNRKRFLDKVYPEPNTGCWLYMGKYSKEGYGQLDAEYYDGFKTTHRFSYFIHYGDFDRTLCVMHKCDQPCCVNPEHLKLGTNKDNIADMVAKGRGPRGTRNVKAKLNEMEVLKIRELAKSGIGVNEIARIYSMAHSSIGYVINRKSWDFV